MGGGISGGQMAIELDPYEKCLNIYPMEAWEKRLSYFTSKLNRKELPADDIAIHPYDPYAALV